ncbi:MAG TPA: CapA family protein [Mycobacterium sp.]|nr:CapA family protein [Mycobacterium sp.]
MLGRGVDQILAHPGNPALREPYVDDAAAKSGWPNVPTVRFRVPSTGAGPGVRALAILEDLAPDVRLINLETTITADGEFADRKAIHYRMHPDNLPVLTAIEPDVCALANNHILDFGRRGLADTLDALSSAGICGIGAGGDPDTAHRPPVVSAHGDHRVVIGSVATKSSGVPEWWAAHRNTPGVWLIWDPAAHAAADDVAAKILGHKRIGDVTIVSVHWGSNWGYSVGLSEIQFAHRLIDAGIEIVHGHSSHHPRPIEVYRGRSILYGCGDVIDDCEGIGGHESYRPDLRLLYLISFDPGRGDLAALRMVPLRVRRIRLERVARTDAEWLRATIEHISRRFGTHVAAGSDDLLVVHP